MKKKKDFIIFTSLYLLLTFLSFATLYFIVIVWPIVFFVFYYLIIKKGYKNDNFYKNVVINHIKLIPIVIFIYIVIFIKELPRSYDIYIYNDKMLYPIPEIGEALFASLLLSLTYFSIIYYLFLKMKGKF